MQLSLSRKEMYTRGRVLDEVMDTAFDMSVLVDDKCRIVHMSKNPYSGISAPRSIVGQSIKVLDAVSPFEEVIQSGKAATGLLLDINGRKTISSVFPIVDDGCVIGAMGTVLFYSLAAIKRILGSANLLKDPKVGELYQDIAHIDSGYSFSDFIGESQPVRDLLSKAQRVAENDVPVLLIGETGTGKEIIASGIHTARHSERLAPYVTINCTAIPGNLLESELFGHVKGAFTGAVDTKIGKFQHAANGDILLDEIGDMDLQMQGKLLRVLESRQFEQVGGNTIIPFNAGIIASTNKNLLQMSMARNFRADLYYRLCAVELRLPPLRDHVEDIPLLIEHFSALRHGKLRFSRQAMDYIKRYPWPGNVRQLKNFIDRCFIFYKDVQMTGERVLAELEMDAHNYGGVFDVAASAEPQKAAGGGTPMPLDRVEKDAIERALQYTSRNMAETARLLGISRATLYKKVERYGV